MVPWWMPPAPGADAGPLPARGAVRSEDDYTGTYEANYEDFSGTELLFGGTTLDRAPGTQ